MVQMGVRLNRLYRGRRNEGVVVVDNGSAKPLHSCRELLQASDTFDWGRGYTPGAIQLAAAMICDATKGAATTKYWSERLAAEIVAELPDEWLLSEGDILDALANWEAEENGGFENYAGLSLGAWE